MMMFIVRFQPLAGGTCTDAHFRGPEKAKALYDAAWERVKTPMFSSNGGAQTTVSPHNWMEFKDDFGIQAIIDLNSHNIILTDTHKSAAGMKAMTEANHDAFRTYGLVQTGGTVGSTH